MISWGVKLGLVGGAWIAGSSYLAYVKYFKYSGDRFVFANYHDYISPEVMEELKEKYKVLPDNFEHDHMVKEQIKKKAYDVAVVSTSIIDELRNEKLLKEIDWSKLKYADNNLVKPEKPEKPEEKPKFTEIVNSITEKGDFLKWGIPYFVNKLAFCYAGDEISSLKVNNNQKISWKKLIEEISKEERFKSVNGKPTIAMIDDPRTILSLSRFVEEKQNVNPENNEYKTEKDILKSYSSLKDNGLSENKLGKNFLFATPNSAELIDSLASGAVKGGFMYNGDCLFAAQGGNLEDEGRAKKGKFHIVDMDKDIFFLDFIVISKFLNPKKEENVYQFINELLFKQMNEKSKVLNKKQNSQNEEYEHTATRNFDYVNYTPVLETPLTAINESYFNEESNEESNEETIDKETLKKILKVEKPSEDISKHYETRFDENLKNNMLIAFEKFKASI